MILGFISPETLNVKHYPFPFLSRVVDLVKNPSVSYGMSHIQDLSVSFLLVLFSLFLEGSVKFIFNYFWPEYFQNQQLVSSYLPWAFMCYGLLGEEHGFLILSIHLNSWLIICSICFSCSHNSLYVCEPA